jgi:hypothetical protein
MGKQHIGYDIDIVKEVLGALDDPENCCVFVDFQQIYGEENLAVLRAREVVGAISDLYPQTNLVVCGSSFPNSFVEYGLHSGPVRILERKIWEKFSEDFNCRYGDYAAVNVEGPSGGRRPPARVDYAQTDHWRFERRTIPNRETDPGPFYQEAAQAVMSSDSWDPEDGSWGADEIRAAAAGHLEGRKGQRRWSAVRINLHLYRQISSLNSLAGDAVEEDWEDL